MALVLELVLQALASMLEVLWTRDAPPPVPRRLRRARATLRELAQAHGDHGHRTIATLGPELGRAKVTLDGETDRLVIECPWDGVGPTLAPQLPWDRLPPLFAPLRLLRGIDTVASGPRMLTVSGDLSAGEQMRETLRAVARVASSARRLRETLEVRELREGWSVALFLDGARVILRRPLACGPRANGSEHVAAILPGIARCEVGEGVIDITWGRVPSDDEIEAVDRGLRALARDAYR